jgi:hypothetical protein
MTFMMLLIGVFDNSAFEKLRHYPRPIIERSAPAPPILEPHRIDKPGTSSHTIGAWNKRRQGSTAFVSAR